MMAYEAEGRKIADDLKNQYGKLLEAHCVSKSPWKIVLVFSNGTWEVPSNFIFKFGYSGSGVDCFHAFLEHSGLNVPKAALQNAEEGTIFRS
jgi:hypothetical protein